MRVETQGRLAGGEEGPPPSGAGAQDRHLGGPGAHVNGGAGRLGRAVEVEGVVRPARVAGVPEEVANYGVVVAAAAQAAAGAEGAARRLAVAADGKDNWHCEHPGGAVEYTR
jgi:hypothetical protein